MKIKKYVWSWSLIVMVMVFLFSTPNHAVAKLADPSHVGTSAVSAILVDADSGRILYEKDIDKKMRIASLTKIMTAIIAIEQGNLKDLVTTSDNAFGVEGSSIYLKKGEKMSLENMLYGLMLRSGNDAAVAIAEHIGGSVEGFVYLMNEKAAYLGMNHSHFMNPNGLDHKEHYSTARDMAILTSYALKNPVFKEIVSTKVKTAPLEGEKWDRKWANKNKLLQMYPYANGVKTGYTKLAKRTLASAAYKDGLQLAAITLNDGNDWSDSIRLFEYGFSQFSNKALIEKDQKIQANPNLAVKNENDFSLVAESQFQYPLKDSEQSKISTTLELNNQLKKDNLMDGQRVGYIKIYLSGDYIGSVPVRFHSNSENTWSKQIKNTIINVVNTLN